MTDEIQKLQATLAGERKEQTTRDLRMRSRRELRRFVTDYFPEGPRLDGYRLRILRGFEDREWSWLSSAHWLQRLLSGEIHARGIGQKTWDMLSEAFDKHEAKRGPIASFWLYSWEEGA